MHGRVKEVTMVCMRTLNCMALKTFTGGVVCSGYNNSVIMYMLKGHQ